MEVAGTPVKPAPEADEGPQSGYPGPSRLLKGDFVSIRPRLSPLMRQAELGRKTVLGMPGVCMPRRSDPNAAARARSIANQRKLAGREIQTEQIHAGVRVLACCAGRRPHRGI